MVPPLVHSIDSVVKSHGVNVETMGYFLSFGYRFYRHLNIVASIVHILSCDNFWTKVRVTDTLLFGARPVDDVVYIELVVAFVEYAGDEAGFSLRPRSTYVK